MAENQTKKPAWQCKIKAGNLMNRVLKHAKGEIEMTDSQLKAAALYLKKVIPDIRESTVTLDGQLTVAWPIPKSALDE